MSKRLNKIFFVAMLVLWSSASFASDDCNDPLNPNPDLPDCDPDIYVPIDDGVYFLLAAGVLIGYTLLKQRNSVKVN